MTSLAAVARTGDRPTTFDVVFARLWCAHCGQTYECKAAEDFMLPLEQMLGVDRFGGVYGWLGRHCCGGAIDYGF